MAICGRCKVKVTGSTFFTHPCKDPIKAQWQKVVDLKKAGNEGAADTLAKKLMGIVPDPMTEEAKEKLRTYRLEHAEEIRQKAKLKRMRSRILRDRLTPKIRKFL